MLKLNQEHTVVVDGRGAMGGQKIILGWVVIILGVDNKKIGVVANFLRTIHQNVDCLGSPLGLVVTDFYVYT